MIFELTGTGIADGSLYPTNEQTITATFTSDGSGQYSPGFRMHYYFYERSPSMIFMIYNIS